MASAAELHIERGVPIPTQNGGRTNKYPFSNMQTGESVFLPGFTIAAAHNALAYHKRPDRKFICRTVEGGTRVWRIA